MKHKKLIREFLKRASVGSVEIDNGIRSVDCGDPGGAYYQFPDGSYTLTIRGYYKNKK